MARSPYVSGLLPRIRDILGASDLSTVSDKAVRKNLISRGEDPDTIKQYRNEIDEEIGKIYDDLCANSPPSPPPPASQSKSSASIPIPQSSQPEPLSRIKPDPDRKPTIKTESKPRPKPEPAMTIAEEGEGEESDGAIARRLQREFDMLDGGGRGGRSTRPGTTRVVKKKTPKKKVLSKKRVREDGDDEESDVPKKKRGGGGGGTFNKELILSDTLSALLNETRLSRPQVVKRIWEHIKEHDLQDPKDKRMILCDEPMKAVFHTDRLHMFTMNKLLVPHVRDPDFVVGQNEDQKDIKVAPPVVKRDEHDEEDVIAVQSSDGYESEDGYD